jgi:hypothetical protein
MQRKNIPFAFTSLFVLLVLILPGGASTAPVRVSSSPRFAKPAATKTGYATGTDAAILGWDGDGDAAIAHSNGSFDIRDGKDITVGFGIYHSPTPVQWYNDQGYLPALVVQFERDHCTVKINSFGDRVILSGHAYVIVYSRVSIYNHDSVFHIENPAPSPQLIALNTALNLVQPGQTINHDYAIAIDRFGGTYTWPSNAAIGDAGSWSTHYAHMQAYWNQKLVGIVNISHLPDMRLVNAYKAGYIYTNIVKDGNNLNVGENGYGQLYDHDLIAIQVDLYELGDLANAHAYLKTLFWSNYRDAEYTYSWPWAIYLLKTGDTSFVNTYFAKIKESAHSIETDRTGPEGIIGRTNDIDAHGYWTVDDETALLGLLAYGYVAQQSGYKSEVVWANHEYTSLLTSVNTQLSHLIHQYHLNYIPCALNEPNTMNRCRYPTDANWASMFLFGRWAWDGYLFNGAQRGPLLDMIDQTYDYGFGRLVGKLPAHTYGGYTGYSTAYNAGYGATGLRGNKYRSESIYDYEFMISNTQSGPFSWWENVLNDGPGIWIPGNHGLNGTGSCPHMWGQANATKALLESLVAEKINAQLLIGRGVPNSWMEAGQHIDISNLPIHQNKRIDLHISSTGNTITLTLVGATPDNTILFNLPIFVNNIRSATSGTIDNSAGLVTLSPMTRSVTVTLDHAA